MQVWHEKWGEDYARDGDACLKWTDRWSETILPDGRQRAQGDKWREEFGHGNGNKTGETWHADENGHRCDCLLLLHVLQIVTSFVSSACVWMSGMRCLYGCIGW